MPTNKTLIPLVALIAILAFSGCLNTPNQLGYVTQHRLDLQPEPNAIVHTPRPQSAVASTNMWKTSGYRVWKYIVVHHSATARGNAASFDQSHRQRGWDELGYHFVIDNGKGGPDGQIEVGGRWRKQKWGAHTGGTPNNEYNNHGIGICLVGDFSSNMPSRAQIAALEQLIRKLANKYNIDPDNVIGHREGPKATTACPGGVFLNWITHNLRPRLRTHLATTR
ncbi:MAG: N-acetylmuramoyl-L-alanine amidase [bacterium]|nr:N-acetylmuramoyl-L-alanine amidase [bacterium]